MSGTLIQFRTEEAEKQKAIQILERLGLTLPAYLKMCMSRLNRENGIPFAMKLETDPHPGIDALKRASRISKEYGTANMTLEEINAEIAEGKK